MSECRENRLEQALLELGEGCPVPGPIFILAAPRTGSTFLYQTLVRVFALPYISNLTNEFYAHTPILGLSMQHGVKIRIDEHSHYGKTTGLFQPSEGSGPMTFWFGGEQPSQSKSSRIVGGREAHFIRTIAACETLYDGAPLVIKNAWNCFRVAYLATALPGARFIWIRRDIREAAGSDLEARYLTKGDPRAWNSATPANVEALRRLQPAHQVVENQYEFNRAVETDLASHAAGRYLGVWYEDFVRDPQRELERLARFIQRESLEHVPERRDATRRDRALSAEESGAISSYVSMNYGRFGTDCHEQGDSCSS